MRTFEFGSVALQLPSDADGAIGAWSTLRSTMVRVRPDAFTRDEWAYLIAFLDAAHLESIFTDTFGPRTDANGPITRLGRPRGSVVVWLPNNVTLLGPLTLILLSLTGNRIFMKEGSRAEGLTIAFADYVREHGDASLLERIEVRRADRDDPTVAERTKQADVLIVFGSDAAAEAASHQLRPEATLLPFADRRSEAWLRKPVSDETLVDLIKVFAIYGQAGCTSPARVIAIDGNADELRERIVRLWPERLRNRAPHVASANVLAAQLAAARGWKTSVVPNNTAVIASGTRDLESVREGLMLPILALSVEEANASMPAGIQTVGHNVEDATARAWLANAPVKRIVPVSAMHHFGPVWDGREWWRECFEWIAISATSAAARANPTT